MNTDHAANDLTQLSSREQLSALMDSALPADQTRFLLRRLQHDEALAGCWERWRIAGDTLRGLAPAQRLPADFAARVAAGLHANAPVAAPTTRVAGTPAWVRWGVGGTLAAALAMVALMARQSPVAAPAAAPQPAQVAVVQAPDPAPVVPSPTPDHVRPAGAAGQQALAAATAVAAIARPLRESRRPAHRTEASLLRVRDDVAAPALVTEAAAPDVELVARPWPRSILPQYAHQGLTVGFGTQPGRLAAEGNPFAAITALPAPHAALAADATDAEEEADAAPKTDTGAVARP